MSKRGSDVEGAGAVGGILSRYVAAAGTIFHSSGLPRANQGERPVLGRPPIVLRRSGSVCGTVEDVLGGVGHIRQVANVYARIGRSLATDRVHPLHESYIGEDARANACERAELEPGNGVRIRGASRHP